MKYLITILSILLFSCGSNLEIPQDKVVETLTAYGKENPENEIVIRTNLGEIELKLYDVTPIHRANFIRLIKNNFFDNQKIYRIVKGMCIQGGVDYHDKLKYLIPSEFRPNLVHKRGALSMARYSEGNTLKMSSSTEFFIISKGSFYEPEELTNYPEKMKEIYQKIGGETSFDNQYTVFGEVTKGMEIVDKIVRLELVDVEKPLNMPNFSIEILKK